MKRVGPVAGGAVVLAMWLLAPDAAWAQSGTVERPFAPGGRVRMNLSAAGYSIQPGRDDRIVVRWEARSAEDGSKVKVYIETRGSEATVTTYGPHDNLHMIVELPARTDLHIDLSAGDLRIGRIEGNKDVGAWAGDISIDVGRAEDYRSIDTAVKAGDIKASAFHVSKGGLFRSFSWHGAGRYTLRVRLTAGKLRLYDDGQAAVAARPPEAPAAPQPPKR